MIAPTEHALPAPLRAEPSPESPRAPVSAPASWARGDFARVSFGGEERLERKQSTGSPSLDSLPDDVLAEIVRGADLAEHPESVAYLAVQSRALRSAVNGEGNAEAARTVARIRTLDGLPLGKRARAYGHGLGSVKSLATAKQRKAALITLAERYPRLPARGRLGALNATIDTTEAYLPPQLAAEVVGILGYRVRDCPENAGRECDAVLAAARRFADPELRAGPLTSLAASLIGLRLPDLEERIRPVQEAIDALPAHLRAAPAAELEIAKEYLRV